MDKYYINRGDIRIEFYPNNSKGGTIVTMPMPDIIIENGVEMDSGFEDLPRGLALAREIKLQLDLTKLKSSNEKALKRVILSQMSDKISLDDGLGLKQTLGIPNIWTLRKGGKTYFFAQNFTPEKKIKISDKGHQIYELTLTELHKFYFERLMWSEEFRIYIETLCLNASKYYDAYYIYDNKIVDLRHTLGTFKMLRRDVFLNAIEDYYKQFLIYSLGATIFVKIEDPYKYVKFFKHTYTRENPLGDVLPLNEQYFVAYASTSDGVVDGFFTGEYKNFWDFYKKQSEAGGVKTTLEYIDETHLEFKCYPILDSDKTINLSFLDNSIVENELEITQSYKLASKFLGHIRTGSNGDVTEYERITEGTLNDSSEEVEFPLHSNLSSINSKVDITWDGSYLHMGTLESKCDYSKILYRYDTGTEIYFIKAHERSKIYLDNNLTLEAFPLNPIFETLQNYPIANNGNDLKKDFDLVWNNYINFQSSKLVLPNYITAVYQSIFGNENQSYIELEVPESLISHSDIGRKIELDFTELDEDFTFLSIKGLIIGVNSDIKESIVKVKIFIRDDNWSI